MAMTTRPSLDHIVDPFVERLDASSRQPLPAQDVPEVVRDGDPRDEAWVAWRVRSAPGECTWIADLEAKLPGRLPPSFRALVSR